jgi:hypothetical protein
MPTVDQVLEFLIRWMKAPKTGSYHNYGYDVYIPNLAKSYVTQEEGHPGPALDIEPRVGGLVPIFLAAAWELCRLGVWRPSVNSYEGQGNAQGFGYSITPAGQAWLDETDEQFVPTQPNAFARLLEPFRTRFGAGFNQRAQEAVRCRWAGANLACCAMCGAAAESILLALAIAKTSDENRVRQMYRSANGRSQLHNVVFGQATGPRQRQSRSLSELLEYWRDEASHGQESDISQFEASEALARLLRFAHFANDHWEELTRPPGAGPTP